MAYSNKKSWRLQFIDLDSSFSLSNNVTPIIGWFAARAPKGEVRATYFGPGNGSAIDAMIGVASANWPDIVEARAFNEEYGTYISAPPGSSVAYPSHFGGFYVTKTGLHNFWDITDKQELKENSGNAYIGKIAVTEETAYYRGYPTSKINLVICSEPFTGVASGTYYYKANGSTGTADDYVLKIDVNPDGATIPQLQIIKSSKIKSLNCFQYDSMKNGIVNSNLGSVRISWGHSTAVSSDTAYRTDVYIDAGLTNTNSVIMNNYGFTDVTDITNSLKTWIGQTNYDQIVIIDTETGNIVDINTDDLAKLLLLGYFTTPDGDDEDSDPDVYSIPFPISGMFFFGESIRDETLCYFVQKSATEKATNIKISQIGYDKYVYDEIIQYGTPTEISEATFTINDVGKKIVSLGGTNGIPSSIKEVYEDESTEIISLQDVTDNYVTKRFVMFAPFELASGTSFATNKNVEQKVYYVADGGIIKEQYTEEYYISQYGTNNGKVAYEAALIAGEAAPKDWRFNTLTISCSEEVYAGKQTSGGEFQGSLLETGINSYGTNIYFLNVLSPDDLSFIEVGVVNPIEEDDLTNGFWTNVRIIDPYDADKDSLTPSDVSLTITGDRYCDAVMNMNLLEKKTGGIWRNEYKSIISEALQEALNPEYDDANIFVEPTGQATFKSFLPTIRKNQELATVISPQILSPNSRDIYTEALANKEIVNGRSAGVALYAGEFKVFDSVTSKYYWRQPIGDVACNLARIMDLKMGGWAPAWTNITGNLGGQLKTVTTAPKYTFEDLATKILDGKGINPITMDADYGVMIRSQVSTLDQTNKSDWCYLGHSMSFDLVKREIRNNVMIPQIMKPINDYWMGIRQTQVDSILAKRTSGTDPIWSLAICDIKGVNTAMTALERKFCIKVQVRVYVFSETVELTLEVLSQV